MQDEYSRYCDLNIFATNAFATVYLSRLAHVRIVAKRVRARVFLDIKMCTYVRSIVKA